jgi:PRD1 phage membrane DNA delivery
MNGGQFIDVLTGIVFVALVATLVAHPGTVGVINAAGNAFSNSLKTATAG